MPIAPAWDRSGASNGWQPRVGSTKASSSRLSLPLLIFCAPASAVSLAALSWAVWPLPVSRYVEVTLSLWSWSTRAKDRVDGQACPVLGDRPSEGTFSRPTHSSQEAAAKNWVPLQKDTWPKIDPCRPSVQFPSRSALRVAPTWVRLVPLNPKSMVTTAFLGRVGTTGAAAGWVPLVMTSGS